MKEFLKWLGVNEKIAKIAVWLLIFMVSLIILNVFLESVGFPYYKINAENLSKIDCGEVVEFLIGCLISVLNFYTTVFLVLRVKEFKKTIKYALLYLILNATVISLFNNAVTQIVIIVYILVFLYMYKNKNWKYILYGICSLLLNAVVQYACYLYKGRFVDFKTIGTLNTFITSLDYFILMFFIIAIKEIYLNKKLKK